MVVTPSALKILRFSDVAAMRIAASGTGHAGPYGTRTGSRVLMMAYIPVITMPYLISRLRVEVSTSGLLSGTEREWDQERDRSADPPGSES